MSADGQDAEFGQHCVAFTQVLVHLPSLYPPVIPVQHLELMHRFPHIRGRQVGPVMLATAS